MKTRALLLASALLLGGCGGVFESDLPAPQAYVLRLPPGVAAPAPATQYGSVLLQRPEAGPGLDSDHIVLLRSDNRFDFYATITLPITSGAGAAQRLAA